MSDNGSYSVLYWRTHPDEDNDDCETGDTFATKEEALAVYNDHRADYYPAGSTYAGQAKGNYIEIDGPDINEVRMRDGFDRAAYDRQAAREKAADDRAWRREQAMEAGMGLGIEAFNEAMGYTSEPYDCDEAMEKSSE